MHVCAMMQQPRAFCESRCSRDAASQWGPPHGARFPARTPSHARTALRTLPMVLAIQTLCRRSLFDTPK